MHAKITEFNLPAGILAIWITLILFTRWFYLGDFEVDMFYLVGIAVLYGLATSEKGNVKITDRREKDL